MDPDAIRRRLKGAEDVASALRDMAAELCSEFGAERITVYVLNDARDRLTAIVHAGLDTVKGARYLSIPADPRFSVAGYAAQSGGVVNIRDAYDDAELDRFQPPVAFLRAVDTNTGFHTRQLLVVRIPGPAGQPLGVVQFINRVDGGAFPPECERDVVALAAVIGEALAA